VTDPPAVLYNAISASPTVRGVERYHLGVLPALAALDPGLRIAVLRAPWQGYYDALAEAGLELATVAPPRGRLARGLWQLADGGQRGRPARLLHLGNVLPVPAGVRAPIVAMVHDVIEFRARRSYDPVRRWARRRLVRRLARRARAVVTVAEPTARALAEILGVPAGRIVTVGIGADPIAAPAVRPAADRERAVVFVGALDEHKRLDLAVSALARIPGLELRVVSAGGPAEAPLRRLARELGVADRVAWLGRLPDQEARRVVAASAALLMPSDVEGFGLPVLEALQVGTPAVLSSGIPLAEEWGRRGGPVFRAGDAGDLAAALAAFLDDPGLRDRLGRSGPELAGRFTWPEVASRLRAVWEDVLAGRR
jgi:glycosyltransferase involved in cell wall biosynthesis